MDSKHGTALYSRKRKVIDAIYFLGKYYDPDIITLQAERAAELAFSVIGVLIVISAFLHY